MLTNTELEDIKMLINIENNLYKTYLELSAPLKRNNDTKKKELISELKTLTNIEENILNRLINSERKLKEIEKYLKDNKFIDEFVCTEAELIDKKINQIGFSKMRLANRIQNFKSKMCLPESNGKIILIKPTKSSMLKSYVANYLYDKDFFNLITYYLYQELDNTNNKNRKDMLIDKIISLVYLDKEQETDALASEFTPNKTITLMYDYITSNLGIDKNLVNEYKKIKINVMTTMTLKALMIPDIFYNDESLYDTIEYIKAMFKSCCYLADSKTKENLIKQIEVLKNTPQGNACKKGQVTLIHCMNEVETSKNQIYIIKSLAKN